MNDKTVRLYSFDRFDKASGIYYLKCICGAITPLRPEEMNALTVPLKCSGCYLTYNVKMSCELWSSLSRPDMDIGIAKFYLKQYDDAVSSKIGGCFTPSYYLLELESQENDSSVRRDVEYNVYEALHQKYRSLTTEEQKNACVKKFHTLFPTTRYCINDDTNQHPALYRFEEYLNRRLSVLQTICRDIEREKR